MCILLCYCETGREGGIDGERARGRREKGITRKERERERERECAGE